MSGFDQPPIFFTDSFNDAQSLTNDISNRSELLNRFKRFIKEFQTLTYEFCYRDALKKNFYLCENYLNVNLDHLSTFDNELCERVLSRPNEHIPLFESAAEVLIKEMALISNENVISTRIQIILTSSATAVSLRDLKSDLVSKLVKIPGVIINASAIKSKAVKITLQCRSCQTTIPNINLNPGLDGYALPRKCPSNQSNGIMNGGSRAQCPLDPFFVIPDKCECIDYQILKLQELPESNPTGEIPRHMTLFCDRYLVERVTPGTRVTVTGIYSIKKMSSNKGKIGDGSLEVGIRKPYLRVVGIELDRSDRIGIVKKAPNNIYNQVSFGGNTIFTAEEEALFRKFASSPNAYEIITKNIAPSIYGGEDIKKSIACLLFGGSRKRLPDGLIRRGDINILLLGDPGTAKSQLLKFVEKVAPISYYTSGKGSSAAGLTASLNKDAHSRGFVIEGGAMVLADGGVVCIDEFDKMREDDRVAIHEAMEQQTISIAKAGITTKLNSRCAVLAAANSVFGRWDTTKGDQNIEFMPTILSRFDMIYIVKDEHNAQRDMQLASHVLQVHIDSGIDRQQSTSNEPLNVDKGELTVDFLTRYIAYCKQNCAPRLTPLAAEKLKHCYVHMRNHSREIEKHLTKKASITITVRQLEAITRISESLAKMCLENFATEKHVEEAIRLFKVSTLEAASSGSLTGAEGFIAREDMEEIRKIEKQIKQRFAIGTQVTEQRIVQDLLKQRFTESSIQNVLSIMLRRGELQHRLQRKIICRVR